MLGIKQAEKSEKTAHRILLSLDNRGPHKCSAPQGIERPTQTLGFPAMSLQAQRQTQPLIDFGHEQLISLAQNT
jgi:hypothetical protein